MVACPAHPESIGWSRAVSGGSCAQCATLAGRVPSKGPLSACVPSFYQAVSHPRVLYQCPIQGSSISLCPILRVSSIWQCPIPEESPISLCSIQGSSIRQCPIPKGSFSGQQLQFFKKYLPRGNIYWVFKLSPNPRSEKKTMKA